jgi:hypothetical protein
MTTDLYIEDLFVKIYEMLSQDWAWSYGDDDEAANNFYNLAKQNLPITENQSKYILKILHKNHRAVADLGFDYKDLLSAPRWKRSFRVLDQSKKVWVEKNKDGEINLVLKMPYALKNELEKIIARSSEQGNGSVWDKERSVRLVDIYDVNLIVISDFVEEHKFDIDPSFTEILAQVEELWQQQDEIIPQSITVDDQVVLKNLTPEADRWWQENKTGDRIKDIFLAKQAGYRFFPENIKNSVIEKIASSTHAQFWIKTNERFFELYQQVGGPVAVLVTKNPSADNFVKEFVSDAEKCGVDRSDIRICYRLSKEEDKGFNQWVKDSGLGGKVEGGKILVFQNKPPKWLFSQDISVKIILTNSCFPVPSVTTQSWMNSHPCVCYVGDISVSNIKEKTIVDL